MKAVVLDIHDIAPEVRHFVFEVPGIEQLHFKPGQFVSFNETLKGKKITRPYSIVSLPDGNRFELCLNLVHEGVFTPHLFEMKPGDSIEMSAPLGFFVVRDPAKEAVFIATGTGIAPFRAMTPDYLSHPAGQPTHAHFRRTPRTHHLLSRRFRSAGRQLSEFPFLADPQPPRAFPGCILLDGPHRTCASASGGGHWRSPRSGHLHLRTQNNGRRRTRYPQRVGIRSQADHFRKVRLNINP